MSNPLENMAVLAQGNTQDLGELCEVLATAGVTAQIVSPPGSNINC